MTLETEDTAPLVETTAAETVVETPAVETPAVETTEGPKSLLDAVSAGIAEGAPRKIVSKGEQTEEEIAADKRPRNADGTFKTETAEEKATREEAEEAAKLAAETPEQKAARLAAETPEQKAAREAKEAAAAKKADPINDPIPDGLNKRTTERIKSLIDTVKAQETLVAQHGELFGAITATGASPDEFSTMLSYMGAVHSDDPKRLEAAYSLLQGELRGLAIKMGKPLFEVNLLRDAANADLVQEIQEGKITNQRAHELALARERTRVETTRTKTTTDATQATNDYKAAQTAATAELDVLDTELRAKDGNAVFQAKYNVLVPMLNKLFQRIDPKEWKGIFLEHYNNLAVPAAAAVTPAPAAVVPDKPTPMRPKSPAGAGSAIPAPKSALDAISQALDGM